jgi:hypothetical protein
MSASVATPLGRVVIYATNNDPQQIMRVHRSVRTLRRHNTRLRVVHVVFDEIAWGPEARDVIDERGSLQVEVVRLPFVPINPKARTRPLLDYLLLKWKALASVNSHRALVLDSDTFVFSDVEALFDRYHLLDFYARIDFGRERDRPRASFLYGTTVCQPNVDYEAFDRLFMRLGLQQSHRLSVYNTGIMLFNHGYSAAIVARLSEMSELFLGFLRRAIPYPATNLRIIDQVVSTVVLSSDSERRCGLLDVRDCPYFIEMLTGEVSMDNAIICHTWSEYYPFALDRFR